jgi:S-formylglutathione hydrolase FrmB
MIEVMPFGSPSMFRDEEWANGVSPGNAWETFLARDVVDAVDARFRTIASGRGRAIAGLSEGGYGALNVALHHPAEFDVIESWSGYVLAVHVTRVFGGDPQVLAYNSPMFSVRAAAPVLKADYADIWFYIGRDDKSLWQNEQFAAELGRLGVVHTFFVSSGAHSWALWRRFTDQALMVASEHLAHG